MTIPKIKVAELPAPNKHINPNDGINFSQIYLIIFFIFYYPFHKFFLNLLKLYQL